MKSSTKMIWISGVALFISLIICLTEIIFTKVGGLFNGWFYFTSIIFIFIVFSHYSQEYEAKLRREFDEEKREKIKSRKEELSEMSDMDFYNLTFIPVGTEEFKLQANEVTKRWRAIVTKSHSE